MSIVQQALVLTVCLSAAANAQQPVLARDFGGWHVEVRAKAGRVELFGRSVDKPDPVLLVSSSAIVALPEMPPPQNLPGRMVRVFLDPSTARRVVRDAREELAVANSIRFPVTGGLGPRMHIVSGDKTMSGVEAYRSNPGDHPNGYFVGAWTCRQGRMGMYTLRSNWLAIVDALRRAAAIAESQRGTRAAAPTTIEETPCPARPFAGNPPIIRARPDFLGPAHAATIELVVDSTGIVVPRSIHFAGGDTVLFAAAGPVLSAWRFAPALDTDRRRIAQRVRFAVIDRAPVTAADGARVREVAATTRAQFVAVAEDLRVPQARTFASHDGTVSLHALTFGSFPQIVFLPNIGGRADDWTVVAQSLPPAMTAVSYDLRGQGGSTRSLTSDYSLEAHVRDLETVMDSSTAPSAILVAHGSSAVIAAEFARRFPRRVRAIVLVAPLGGDNGDTPATRVGRFRAAFETRYRRDWTGAAFADYSGFVDDGALLRNRIANDVRATPPDALAGTLASVRFHDIPATLASYPGQVYVLFAIATTRTPMVEPMHMFGWTIAPTSDASRVHVTRALDMGLWAPVLEPRPLSEWLNRVLVDAREPH
jgi:pimeloyl-ACP methyl ester carboxylesterase